MLPLLPARAGGHPQLPTNPRLLQPLLHLGAPPGHSLYVPCPLQVPCPGHNPPTCPRNGPALTGAQERAPGGKTQGQDELEKIKPTLTPPWAVATSATGLPTGCPPPLSHTLGFNMRWKSHSKLTPASFPHASGGQGEGAAFLGSFLAPAPLQPHGAAAKSSLTTPWISPSSLSSAQPPVNPARTWQSLSQSSPCAVPAAEGPPGGRSHPAPSSHRSPRVLPASQGPSWATVRLASGRARAASRKRQSCG